MGYEFWKAFPSAQGPRPLQLESSPSTGTEPGAGYNVALYLTGLSSRPDIREFRIQADLTSGIFVRMNSPRRRNEALGGSFGCSDTDFVRGRTGVFVPKFPE